MSEWKPVVGGRCVYLGNDAVVVEYRSGYATAKVECAGPRIPVDATDLREHPDDARHRRLLEAARRVSLAMGLEEFSDALIALRAIVAEYDEAEADHAS